VTSDKTITNGNVTITQNATQFVNISEEPGASKVMGDMRAIKEAMGKYRIHAALAKRRAS